jgi:hypothetical protein
MNLHEVALFLKLSQKYLLFSQIIHENIERGVSPDILKAFIVDDEVVNNKQLEREILRPVGLRNLFSVKMSQRYPLLFNN